MDNIGVVHGRFQPFHLGHLEYVLEGKKRCRFLYIGIANPDPAVTAEHPSNTRRAQAAANPFFYWERQLMIDRSLVEAGVGREEFAVIPFPINYPERLLYYAPTKAIYYLTLYDDWGRAKQRLLSDLGLTTEVLWERQPTEVVTSGTEVRHLMAAGGAWRHLVPAGVVYVIDMLELEVALRERSRRKSVDAGA